MITKRQIQNAPASMGVYVFYKGNNAMYVGKSIHIRVRIKSHIADSKFSKKEEIIVNNSTHIKYHSVLSEFDALILESKLIKQLKPKYNIELKDDKRYLYIKISIAEKYPKITAVRREDDGKSLYFGPFSSSSTTRELLSVIRRFVPFCTSAKISKSPCFYTKIGLCSPCPNVIQTLPDTKLQEKMIRQYKKNIQKIVDLLSGKSGLVYRQFRNEVKSAIHTRDYESGLLATRRLRLLDNLLSRRTFGARYESLFIPNEKVIHDELMTFLHKYFFAILNDSMRPVSIRIECFDISNLFGTHAAASMVVFERDHINKKEYKRFRIRSVHKISDFDMIKEVVSRRFAKKEWREPSLVVIDGGKPQIRAATEALQELRKRIAVIGIAKHPDRIMTANQTIYLPKTSALFKTILSLRDEAHRFARKYHIYLRSKHLV